MRTLATIFFIFTFCCATYAQQTFTPKVKEKTTASITPPDHFVKAKQFNGYIHEATASTILIQEIDGASYLLIMQGMTPDYFSQQGFTLLETEEDIKTSSGLSGVLYRMSFNVQNTDFERIMLFAGDYNSTYWLVANYPSMLKDQVYDVLRNSLLTLKP